MNLSKFTRTVLAAILKALWFLYAGAVFAEIGIKGGFSWSLFVGILLTVVNIVALIKKTNTLIIVALVGDILILAYAFTFLPISEYISSMIIVGLTIIYFPIYLALRPIESEARAA